MVKSLAVLSRKERDSNPSTTTAFDLLPLKIEPGIFLATGTRR